MSFSTTGDYKTSSLISNQNAISNQPQTVQLITQIGSSATAVTMTGTKAIITTAPIPALVGTISTDVGIRPTLVTGVNSFTVNNPNVTVNSIVHVSYGGNSPSVGEGPYLNYSAFNIINGSFTIQVANLGASALGAGGSIEISVVVIN
jgi:hypothetical protein